jgi:hypothetical protein
VADRRRVALSRLAWLLIPSLPWGAAVHAEEAPPVAGTRVRVETVRTVDRQRLTGTLVGVDAERITLQVKGSPDPTVLAASEVSRFEVSAGHRRGKPAAIGALIGVAVAGGLVVASSAGCTGECFCSGSGCLTGFVLLGVPAAAIGGTVGAVVAPEHWKEIRLPAQNRLTLATKGPVALVLAPSAGGGGSVGLACRF